MPHPQVLARVHEVAHSQAVPELVEMCNGPEGPLAAVDLNAPLPPPEDKKKKGKKPKAKAKVCILLTPLDFLHRSLSLDLINL